MKLLPVYNEKAFLNVWPYCIEGAESILEHSTGDSSIEKIFNKILSKELLLWIGFELEQYCGFMTTQVVNTPMGDNTLWIVHVYIKSGVPKDVFLNGLKELNKFAKKYSCNRIKFYSNRDKAFERRLNKFGWEKGYTEFILTMKEG